jgi:hypothetical protein
MQLSKHFGLEELTRSETARREGIPNAPEEAQVANLRTLCEQVLDPLRDAVGMAIKVNSGYRSVKLNQRIGGAANSQHVQGMAADIQAPGMRVLDLFKRVIELRLPFDQIIYEAQNARTKWVHVSHSGAGNRSEIRIAKFGANGKPIGYPIVAAAQALAMDEPLERGIAVLEHDYVEMDDAPAAKPRAPVKKRAGKAKTKVKAKAGAKAEAGARVNVQAKARKAKSGRKAAVRTKATAKKTAKAPANKLANLTARKAPTKATKGRKGAPRAHTTKETSVKGAARTTGRARARRR